MLVFIIGRCLDETLARILAIMADKIHGLPQSLQTYVRAGTQTMPPLLPSTYHTVHYSLITLLFDAIIVSNF
jgi:hypothetical protein